MDMKTYFSGLSSEEKKLLASRLKTSVAYLSQIANQHRSASHKLSRRIEFETDGNVTHQELRPDIFGDEAA